MEKNVGSVPSVNPGSKLVFETYSQQTQYKWLTCSLNALVGLDIKRDEPKTKLNNMKRLPLVSVFPHIKFCFPFLYKGLGSLQSAPLCTEPRWCVSGVRPRSARSRFCKVQIQPSWAIHPVLASPASPGWSLEEEHQIWKASQKKNRQGIILWKFIHK